MSQAAGAEERFMSQQEFEPGTQSNQQDSLNEDDEIHYPQYPYSWSGKLNSEGVPRDEPPSSYNATVMQEGYKAQTSANANIPGSSQQQVNAQYVSPDGDGDAYEQGYRPYNAYNAAQSGQGVPPWARSRRRPRNPARFGFIILILLIIAMLQGMLHGGLLLGFAGGILLLTLSIILVPLVLLLVILGIIMRMFRPRRVRYWRRRPWWY